jgi:hypothetical protein
MGFHEPPCAIASIVLDLVEMHTMMNSDFRLFKKNVLNAGFYDKKPLVTHQRMRKFGQSPAVF